MTENNLNILNELIDDDVVISKSSNLLTFGLNIAKSYFNNQRKIAVFVPSLYESQHLHDILCNFVDENNISLFLNDEVVRMGQAYNSKEMEFEQVKALYQTFLDDKKEILIINQTALLNNLCSFNLFKERTINLEIGYFITREELISRLNNAGYNQVRDVTQVSEYAFRGMILDVYSPNYDKPIRIEFFGDEIDDIRLFSVEKEISVGYLKKCTLIPCSVKLFDSTNKMETFKTLEEQSFNMISKTRDDYFTALIGAIKYSYLPSSVSSLFPYFKDKDNNIVEYLSKYEKYIFSYSDFIEQLNHYYKENLEFFNEQVKNNQAFIKESNFTDLNFSYASLNGIVKTDNECKEIIVNPPYVSRNIYEVIQIINVYVSNNIKLVLCLEDKAYDNLKVDLEENKIEFSENYDFSNKVTLLKSDLKVGVFDKSKNICFLSDKDILSTNLKKSSFLSRYKSSKVIKKYDELVFGDYVVEESYGIGQYQGVINMKGLEYLKIQYADNQILYVPLNQFRFVRKYCGREGYVPSLDKIDGSTWKKRKARITQKIVNMADQLLLLYANREEIKGTQFVGDKFFEEQFDRNFPFKLTDSQEKTLNEVYSDMEKETPMDRLVAGDVGFGKTEIAFRAAFRAILNGKQVAFLCPTTVLARQHYEVALERFKNFDVNICELTRFVSVKKQKEYLKEISEGNIHLVIGSHKLLSEKINFKDLGLLIIDEEQRFGVTHKERIKTIVNNIDCLTLSATPIPRTLELSLVNVRPISILSDPPLNRLPIKTYVTKRRDDLIKEAVYRELGRKGQIYYLFNSVDRIHEKYMQLKTMFPDEVIDIVHGQMDGNSIEDVMHRFYQGEISILLCTTIIESGLDVANANTMIVERAEQFGLSQLYQIKGRVGRSSRLAYCYFLYENYNNITPEGRKRLDALKNFTELGSGFKIANQDLLIRGAGNILGQEQAGHIDSIGYETYNRLLKDVISQRKESKVSIKDMNIFGSSRTGFELSFSLDAIVPIDFTSQENRINIYRELGNIDNDNDLFKYKMKLRDMYGKLPEEIGNLILKRDIEINLNSGIFVEFKESLIGYNIIMTKEFSNQLGLIKKLEEILEPLVECLKVSISTKQITFFLKRRDNYLEDLIFLTSSLNKLANIKNNSSDYEELGDSID